MCVCVKRTQAAGAPIDVSGWDRLSSGDDARAMPAHAPEDCGLSMHCRVVTGSSDCTDGRRGVLLLVVFVSLCRLVVKGPGVELGRAVNE